MFHFPQRFVANKRLVCLFVVSRSLNPSMQVPANFPPLQLAQLLFLLTLIQANDHSRENSHMKCNSCIFYFKILIKSTHTHRSSNHNNQKTPFSTPSLLLFLFSSTTHLREAQKILFLSSSHGLLIIYWSSKRLRIKL